MKNHERGLDQTQVDDVLDASVCARRPFGLCRNVALRKDASYIFLNVFNVSK